MELANIEIEVSFFVQKDEYLIGRLTCVDSKIPF